MDEETAKHLWALRKVNEALIEGLKVAIYNPIRMPVINYALKDGFK